MVGYFEKRICCNKYTKEVEALYRISNSSVSHNKFKTITWHWNILRNVEGLSFIKSLYYFTFYALNGLRKYLIIYIYIYQARTHKRRVNTKNSIFVDTYWKECNIFPIGIFFFYLKTKYRKFTF